MLPDPDDLPVGTAKAIIGLCVSDLITQNLVPPKGIVALRPRPVLRTAVPKTTVNEYGHPRSDKDNVRLPPQAGEYATMHSEAETSGVKLSP